MKIVYEMDDSIVIPEDINSINTYDEIINNSDENLNLKYCNSIREWTEKEINKILIANEISIKYDFSNIIFVFFRGNILFLPEAFYMEEKKLIAIRYDCEYKGSEGNLQVSVLHEAIHSGASDFTIVGLAIAEGIAVYFEKLFCNFYEIQFNINNDKDEGYIFSLRLVESIIKNIYRNNLDEFFTKTKRGNEKYFILDIENYLKNNNIGYDLKYLFRLSSILFYAKELPKNPFEKYQVSKKMEKIRSEILKSFSKMNNLNSLSISNDDIKYIEQIYESFFHKMTKEQYMIFSNHFDKELANLLLFDDSLFKNKDKIKNCLVKCLNGMDYYSKENKEIEKKKIIKM